MIKVTLTIMASPEGHVMSKLNTSGSEPIRLHEKITTSIVTAAIVGILDTIKKTGKEGEAAVAELMSQSAETLCKTSIENKSVREEILKLLDFLGDSHE